MKFINFFIISLFCTIGLFAQTDTIDYFYGKPEKQKDQYIFPEYWLDHSTGKKCTKFKLQKQNSELLHEVSLMSYPIVFDHIQRFYAEKTYNIIGVAAHVKNYNNQTENISVGIADSNFNILMEGFWDGDTISTWNYTEFMFDDVYPVKDGESFYITIQAKRPQNPNDTVYYNDPNVILLCWDHCIDTSKHSDLLSRVTPITLCGKSGKKGGFLYNIDTCFIGTYLQAQVFSVQYVTNSNYVADTNCTVTLCMFPIFGLDTTISGNKKFIGTDTIINSSDTVIATTIVSCDTVIQNLYSAVVCDTIVTYDTVKNSSLSENVDKFTYIYPNPASDKFAIQCSFKINDIEIVNPIGQVILQRKINAYFTDINVTDYEKGTYIVNIRTAGGNTQRKIVIN